MKPTGVSRSSFLDADEPIAFRDIDEYLALTDGSVEPVTRWSARGYDSAIR